MAVVLLGVCTRCGLGATEGGVMARRRGITTLQRFGFRLQRPPSPRAREAQPGLDAALVAAAGSHSASSSSRRLTPTQRRAALQRVWAGARLGAPGPAEAAAELLRVRAPALAVSGVTVAAWVEALAATPAARSPSAGSVWAALGSAIAEVMEERRDTAKRSWLLTWLPPSATWNLEDLARVGCAFALASPAGPNRDRVLDAVAAACGALTPASGQSVELVDRETGVALRSSDRSCSGRNDLFWRRAAWACTVGGRPHTDVFGLPPVRADRATSVAVWDAFEEFISEGGCDGLDVQNSDLLQTDGFIGGRRSKTNAVLASKPFPLLRIDGWLGEPEADTLVKAADSLNLWEASPLATVPSNGTDITNEDTTSAATSSSRSTPTVGGTASGFAMRTSESAVLAEERGLKGNVAAVVASVRSRAAAVLRVPVAHVEPLQLVRYGIGAYYKPHVDWGKADEDVSLWVAGQRVATLLVYLTDSDDHCGGGATHFPCLGVRVAPRRCAAVLWPNVDRDGIPIQATEHEAEPIHAAPLCDEHAGGVNAPLSKVALNIWVRDRPLPAPW
eukprot:TRINITY_DN70105_c0_g1_i1.p1 TRINITY_DN70105_c0_g1~~TRINITY_DN70105_c0_g1_i1.p1  ORF type:complete len:562 (-),score=84.86 TRINITY_DN70105_c0_g1_i1:501-2186(-)